MIRLKNTFLKIPVVISFMIVLGILLSSCSFLSSEKTEKINPDSQSETKLNDQDNNKDNVQPEMSQSADKTNLKSAPLRVYWQSRSDYNPLNTFDYSGKAAFQLMFRSMLKSDKSNVLRPDLVNNATFIPEKNLYHVELIPGIAFSDGTMINARDCAASILKYRENLNSFLNPAISGSEDNPDGNENQTQNSVDTAAEMAEILKRHPDLFPIHQSFYKHEYDESYKPDLLKHDLALLNMIKEINVVDDTNFQLILAGGNESPIGGEVNPENIEDPAFQTENDINTDPESDQSGEQAENSDESTTVIAELEQVPEKVYENDPGVLPALTMPILPENQVNSTAIPSVSSGRYRIGNFESGQLTLEATDQSVPLQQIVLMNYSHANEAMSALVNDQLDFIYLSEEYYNLYKKQNNTNIVSFPGQRYYYLRLGSGEQISDPNVKTMLTKIWQVRDDLASEFTGDQSANHFPLQYTDQAISALGLFETAPATVDQEFMNTFRNTTQNLEMIVPETNLERDWAFYLREKFLNLNIDLKINYISVENYSSALSAGNYDLALNWIDVGYPMNIMNSLEALSPGLNSTLTDEEKSLAQELNNYFNSINRQVDPKIFNEKSTLYRDLINNKYSQIDILGIGFAPVGIFLSKNIEGTSESHMAEPYLGVEKLWVWQ